jgi:hypothetical protein
MNLLLNFKKDIKFIIYDFKIRLFVSVVSWKQSWTSKLLLIIKDYLKENIIIKKKNQEF